VIETLLAMKGQEIPLNQREPEYCMSMSLIENLIMMAERAIDRAESQSARISKRSAQVTEEIGKERIFSES